MKAYKLTDAKHRSYGDTQWGENVTHEAKENGGALCSPSWLHFYEHPLLAVLHNPIHGNFVEPVLWEAEAEGEILRDRQIKAGCKRLTTLKIIPLPNVTTINRVAYGILCALEVYKKPKFVKWAEEWLNGTDRTYAAANAAANAANAAANAANAAANAAYAAAYADAAAAAADADAAYAAANAANAAANAAYAHAYAAAYAAAYADAADAAAAYDAAYAAAAARKSVSLNLIPLAEKAMEVK